MPLSDFHFCCLRKTRIYSDVIGKEVGDSTTTRNSVLLLLFVSHHILQSEFGVWRSRRVRERKRKRQRAMDSSHMASLPEDVTDERPQEQTQPASASVFASVPQRPPTK